MRPSTSTNKAEMQRKTISKFTQPIRNSELRQNLTKQNFYQLDQQFGYSAKEAQQYQALAIKLGIMPKKTKNPKLEENRENNRITGLSYKNAGGKLDIMSQKLIGNQNRRKQSQKPISQKSINNSINNVQNPYSKLKNKLLQSQNPFSNKKQLEQFYHNYTEQQQRESITNENEGANRAKNVQNSRKAGTKAKNINQLQGKLNTLLKQY